MADATRRPRFFVFPPTVALSANRLYTRRPPYSDSYERFVKRFGIKKLYILSAGWGLLSADSLTPNCDITFNQTAEPYKQPRISDPFNDFRMFPEHSEVSGILREHRHDSDQQKKQTITHAS